MFSIPSNLNSIATPETLPPKLSSDIQGICENLWISCSIAFFRISTPFSSKVLVRYSAFVPSGSSRIFFFFSSFCASSAESLILFPSSSYSSPSDNSVPYMARIASINCSLSVTRSLINALYASISGI